MNTSVWETLSSINVNEWVEKKGQFNYLSWTSAWAAVKNLYPLASYQLEEDKIYADATMEVRVTVNIEEMSNTMWLPVLNNKNQAISSPNAFDINSARMRCLVKCLAMFGLGAYIYSGESLPVEPLPPAANEEQLKKFNELVAANDGWGLKEFASTVHISVMDSLFNSAPRGEKMDLKARCREAVKIANTGMRVALEDIRVALNEEKIDQVEEIFAEMGDIERKFTMQGLSEIETIQFEKLKQLN